MTYYQIARRWQTPPTNDEIVNFKQWMVEQLNLGVDPNTTVVVCAVLENEEIGIVVDVDDNTYYCRLTPVDTIIRVDVCSTTAQTQCYPLAPCLGATNGDVFGDLYEHLEDEIHSAHHNIFDKKADAIMNLFAKWHEAAVRAYPGYDQYCCKNEKK